MGRVVERQLGRSREQPGPGPGPGVRCAAQCGHHRDRWFERTSSGQAEMGMLLDGELKAGDVEREAAAAAALEGGASGGERVPNEATPAACSSSRSFRMCTQRPPWCSQERHQGQGQGQGQGQKQNLAELHSRCQ